MENQTKAEFRYGGILLILGAFFTIICILLEVNAGWASLFVEIERTNYEAGTFLFENWAEMSKVWSVALFGNLFFAIASLLLFKHSMKIGWFPSSLFWAIFFIGSLLGLLSFGVCLGSYYHALAVIDDYPNLFDTIRGVALYLFMYGALFQLVALAIYFQQGFSAQGMVPRVYAWVVLVLVIGSFVLTGSGIVSFGVLAIACYIVILLLGLFYVRGTNLPKDATLQE
ncbi:MAG: hypothetical protein AAGD88_07155 [Bacteroidota bacterium]